MNVNKEMRQKKFCSSKQGKKRSNVLLPLSRIARSPRQRQLVNGEDISHFFLTSKNILQIKLFEDSHARGINNTSHDVLSLINFVN